MHAAKLLGSIAGDHHVCIDSAFDRSDLFAEPGGGATSHLRFTVSASRNVGAQTWELLTKDLDDKHMRAISDGKGVLWLAIRNGGVFILKTNAFLVQNAEARILPTSAPDAFCSRGTADAFSRLESSALHEIATKYGLPSGMYMTSLFIDDLQG